VEPLVGVPEGAVDVGGAGVGFGVGACGVSGIEFSQFEGEVIGQLGDLLKRETNTTLKQIGVMRQSPEHRAEIVLIQRLQSRRVVLEGDRCR